MSKDYIVDIDAQALAKRCTEICEERKAENIVLYDVRETSVLADFYLICTANSLPHIRAIAENMKIEINGELGILPRAREGEAASEWIILDYGVLIVHVLDEERRNFYRIEEFWKDEKVVFRSEPAADDSEPVDVE